MSAVPAPAMYPAESTGLHARQLPQVAALAARDVVMLAGLVCEVPYATLMLADGAADWSRPGWDGLLATVPDAAGFLSGLQFGHDFFEINDCAGDARWADLRSTPDPSPFAFCAGVSVQTPEGRVLGTLVVLDVVPRSLSSGQRDALRALGSDAAARLALCEELALARAIINSAPVAIYHADSAGEVTLANPEYRRLLNLGPGDSLRDWAKDIHAEDRPRIQDAWSDFCHEPRPVGFQYRTAPRDGEHRVLVEQVVAADGIPGFVGSIHDATDRVAARERFQRLESLHHNTFEQAPIGVAYANRDGRIVRCNAAFASMLGYGTAELEGLRLDELAYRPDLVQTAAEMDHLWDGGSDTSSIEYRCRHKDRHLLWVRRTATLVRDGLGNPECAVGFFEDISGQKQVADALEGNRNTLEAIVTDVPVAILACDLAGQILLHNRAAATLFAIPSAGSDASAGPGAYAVGVEVLLPDGVTAVPREDRPLARALRGETITNVELMVREPGGRDRTTVNSARQLFGQHGEILGAVVVSQDVTERKEAELELERVHRQLLDASRQAGMAEVATNVLHNVGNVLNSVNVAATRLGDRLRRSKSDGVLRVAAMLEEHSADLATFISTDARGRGLPAYLAQLATRLQDDQRNALEDLATLDTHIDHIKETVAMQQRYARVCGIVETVAVSALVDDCLRMNSGALTRHGVAVRCEIEDVAPITVDKHKVLQILVNLVRNAKYACDESGRPDRLVVVRVEGQDTKVRISVIDNGVGISADNMPQLFRHGFTTRQSGHGFGLHSAALAAQELGGTLQAQSAGVGQGATFILELPREAASD